MRGSRKYLTTKENPAGIRLLPQDLNRCGMVGGPPQAMLGGRLGLYPLGDRSFLFSATYE